MSGEAAALEGIEAVGSGSARAVDMTEMSNQQNLESISSGHVSRMLETAMSSVTDGPGVQSSTDQIAAELSGDASGTVEREKSEMMGGSSGDGSEAPEDTAKAELVERYEKLYGEMTTFQVAWSIARRVQQDTAQLLRGN